MPKIPPYSEQFKRDAARRMGSSAPPRDRAGCVGVLTLVIGSGDATLAPSIQAGRDAVGMTALLAVSTPVVSGIFALGGAVIGAASALLLDVHRASRDKRRTQRAAARLVLQELDVLAELVDQGHWHARRAAQTPHTLTEDQVRKAEERLAATNEKLKPYVPVPPAWKAHRVTLAGILPSEDWDHVDRAMRLLEVHGFPAPEPPSMPWVDEWDQAHAVLHRAVNAMAKYAKQDRHRDGSANDDD